MGCYPTMEKETTGQWEKLNLSLTQLQGGSGRQHSIFCQSCVLSRKLKSHTHVHTLVVAVMGDILLKKIESDPVSLNMIF